MFHPDISLGSTSYFTGQEPTIYSWLNQLVWAIRKVQRAKRKAGADFLFLVTKPVQLQLRISLTSSVRYIENI